MLIPYPAVAAMAIKILMPFPSTHLCELAFSKMLNIITNKRNRIDVWKNLFEILFIDNIASYT